MSIIKELTGTKVLLFDFDGVLIDSYTSIPTIYREIGENLLEIPPSLLDDFVNDMLHGEELHDLGLLGKRKDWWPNIISRYADGRVDVDINTIEAYFWDRRINTSVVIEGVIETLEFLRDNFDIFIMCSRDDQESHKMKRITLSGLDKYFKDFFIIGENMENREKTITKIRETLEVEEKEIAVFDDKVPPLYELKKTRVRTVKVDFDGPLKLAWNLPIRPTVRVKKIKEILIG